MSLFSNDIRVANTATPSFQQQANVSQFGWTSADQGHYNQLIQYVDECRKIWLSLESKIDYVENLLLEIADIDEQVRYVTLKANEVAEDARQTTVDVARTAVIYTQVKSMSDDFGLKYVDFNVKYDDFFTKYPETIDAALSASVSEAGAKEWYDKSKDLYDDLKEGQVYRGTWNPKTGAYPPHQGTNSVWDVILDEGVLDVDFGGYKWRSGDRLLYVVSAGAYQRLATGSGVASVNGETGAVTLTAEKVGALAKTANAVSATKLVTPRTISGVAFDGTSNIVLGPSEVKSVPLDRRINNKLLSADITLNPSDIGALPSVGYTGNLNEISTPGLYALASQTGGPSGAASTGDMLLHSQFSSSSKFQIYQGYGSGRVWVRNRHGGEWGSWRELYSTGNKPTASDIGALPITGGVVSGSISWDTDTYVNSVKNALYLASKAVRVYIEGKENPIARVGGVDYVFYHQGYKPTATDVGALSTSGGTLNKGSTINDYGGGSLNLMGKQHGFVGGPISGYVTSNVYFDGAWRKHDNDLPSANLEVYQNNLEFRTSAAGESNPNTNKYKVYHQGFKPTAADIQVADPRTKKEETLMEVIASLTARIEELEAKLK
ncbi:MAG: hypothetical protein ACRC6V_17815 [Bacteroidales bacterium]